MKTIHLVRKFAALVAGLALTLSVAGSAFANDMTQTESLSVNATVACVAPASASYTLAGGSYDLLTDITVISTNNQTGITITGWVTPYTRVGGGATVSESKRNTFLSVTQGSAGTLSKHANYLTGDWTGHTTAAGNVTLASSTNAVTNAVLHVQHSVDAAEFTVAGNYTATANYSCIVNN